jgi:hypothetical protein
MKMNKLLLLACSCFLFGCSYLEQRGNDFLDCFKVSCDVGLGGNLHLQVGPIGSGVGYWEGAEYGFFGRDRLESRTSLYIGLIVTHFESVSHGQGRSELVLSWLYTWTFPNVVLMGDGVSIVDMFWVTIQFRCLLGFRVGFNLAEFADFILGFFGLDICGDDRKRIRSK